ncbi:hypothetical protein L218DRAFT_991779 [Marasmius fiardii PR-910]|nr:hypothetical protein L218DRAFT_991779 [Marasmius fiardii PR-910]
MSLQASGVTPAQNWQLVRSLAPSIGIEELQTKVFHVVAHPSRLTIVQYILDAENDIKDCQVEINRLNTTIWTAQNKKDVLNKSMKRFCYTTNDLEAKGNSMPTAVTLSHVCGRCVDASIMDGRESQETYGVDQNVHGSFGEVGIGDFTADEPLEVVLSAFESLILGWIQTFY